MFQVGLVLAAGGRSARFFKGESNLQRSPFKDAAPSGFSKLFEVFQGKSVLRHSFDAFRSVPEIAEIIITAPRDGVDRLKKELGRPLPRNLYIVEGGNTRAQSVLNGISALRANYPWVMVHDAARPLVSADAIREMLLQARESKVDALILGRRVVPTLKKADSLGKVTDTVDRTHLWEAETPQLVKRDMILRAYRELPSPFSLTDEASLIEKLGGRVQIVESAQWNPKVTTRNDLTLLQSMNERTMISKSGLGSDIHRLVRGRQFWLGGIRIPSDRGPEGHSDGDALLHAISDAILGALGQGDIGEHFSDRDPRWKGVSSAVILEDVMRRVSKSGFSVTHLDSTVHLEKPKLGPFKKQMVERIAQIMKLKTTQVSVKAKTAEGLGDIGKGLAVSCDAIVTLSESPR